MIIWLASYPRSGNTFLRVILNNVFGQKTYSIYNDKFDIAADKKMSEIVGHELLPDDFDFKAARQDEKLYILKTHDYPENDDDKVIYLIRDGRESSLSFAKFRQTLRAEKDITLLDIIYGNVYFGSWGQHVKAWNPKKRNKTLLVKFEDLVDDPIKQIKQISIFIGLDVVGDKIPSFAELNEINPVFFHSGKLDSWKEEFTEDEHLAFWMKNYTYMMEYGYNQDAPAAFVNGDQVALMRQLSNENTYLFERLKKNHKHVMFKINQQIEEEQKIIEERNNQLREKDYAIKWHKGKLEEKQQIIVERNNQLKDKEYAIKWYKGKLKEKQQIIEKSNSQLKEKQQICEQLSMLEQSITTMRHIGSVVKHPFRKFKAYKKVLALHSRIKYD